MHAEVPLYLAWRAQLGDLRDERLERRAPKRRGVQPAVNLEQLGHLRVT